MQITRVINGFEYTFEVTPNETIGEAVTRTETTFEIFAETSGYVTKIFRKDLGFFKKDEVKCIGSLIGNPDNDLVILRKYGVDERVHLFEKSQCFAIELQLFQKLRDMDLIQIINTKGLMYEIKKNKALKVGQIMNFEKSGAEKQFFVNIEHFKIIERTV